MRTTAIISVVILYLAACVYALLSTEGDNLSLTKIHTDECVVVATSGGINGVQLCRVVRLSDQAMFTALYACSDFKNRIGDRVTVSIYNVGNGEVYVFIVP